jgi:hypothetical protein
MTTRGPELNRRARGWLRFLWRKATTPDDWSERGEPLPWWDRTTSEPVMNFARFDLSESSYAIGIMADRTPAWREVYGQILEELVRRHTTYWAAIDWLTQIGPDPRRGAYPQDWIDVYLPKHRIGQYDVPGWVANGVAPWGLQPDPIGAEGNLFFKGWLNLVMSLHAYVTGEDRWGAPFEVAGVGGTRFQWTQHRLTEWLVELWKRYPAGPHCENTKVWPYCLNAAGLGLALYDRVFGTSRHQAWEAWDAETRTSYYGVEGGTLRWVTLYYDPLIQHHQTVGPSGGFANAMYLIPQDPEFAEFLYHGAAARAGWSNPSVPVKPTADPRFVALGRVLAEEFGDEVTARRLGSYAEAQFEPRFAGADEEEFGWWFRLGEPWPRGQLSAIMMMAEVGGRGAWRRLFQEPNLTKFAQPTVEGVAFPTLGIARAWNDGEGGVLHVSTYPGGADRRGQPTRFRVTRLPDAPAVTVRCDGEESRHWRVLDPNSIEIETDVGDHQFEVVTGPAGPTEVPSVTTSAAATAATDPRGSGRSPVRPRTTERSSGLPMATGLGCPCCA